LKEYVSSDFLQSKLHLPELDADAAVVEICIDALRFPVLLEAAHANAPDSYSRELAIESAGDAGGAAAVSSLETELQDCSMDTRLDVVQAVRSIFCAMRFSPEYRDDLAAQMRADDLHLRSSACQPFPSADPSWDRPR
jgi:hypothetical protein